MRATRVIVLGLVLAALAPTRFAAQGYRLRVDSRLQSVAYRGVAFDSVAAIDTATVPGYAFQCNPTGYCTFYRPGPIVHAAPVSTTADVTVWGLGRAGLSVRAIGRAVGDLGSGDNWPGTSSHVQLLEGYAQYAAERWTAQLGRQTVATRFGFTGFDGGRVTVREPRTRLDATAYAGWGLWRGSVLPVTSPALNPLDEFRPPERTIVAGAGAPDSAQSGSFRPARRRASTRASRMNARSIPVSTTSCRSGSGSMSWPGPTPG